VPLVLPEGDMDLLERGIADIPILVRPVKNGHHRKTITVLEDTQLFEPDSVASFSKLFSDLVFGKRNAPTKRWYSLSSSMSGETSKTRWPISWASGEPLAIATDIPVHHNHRVFVIDPDGHPDKCIRGIDQPDLDPVVLQDIHQIFDQIKAEVPVLAQLDCSVLDIFWAADVNGGWKVQFTFFIEDELDRHEPFQSVPGLFDDFLEFLLFQTHLFLKAMGWRVAIGSWQKKYSMGRSKTFAIFISSARWMSGPVLPGTREPVTCSHIVREAGLTLSNRGMVHESLINHYCETRRSSRAGGDTVPHGPPMMVSRNSPREGRITPPLDYR